MATRERDDVSPTVGYMLAAGQTLQLLTVMVLLLGQFLLRTDDVALVFATAALVLGFGNFVVLYQLQTALFEDGTSEWKHWVR